MDKIPIVGDVISLPNSSAKFVVIRCTDTCQIVDDVYYLEYQKLNPNGSHNPHISLQTLYIFIPYIIFKPLTDEMIKEDNMNADDIAEYQEEMKQEAEEIKIRKKEHHYFQQTYYLDEITFHGHMTTTFVWEFPNTLLP